MTAGDVHNLMSSIGIDWTTWTPTTGVSVDDGAVFWTVDDGAADLMMGLRVATPKQRLRCFVVLCYRLNSSFSQDNVTNKNSFSCDLAKMDRGSIDRLLLK